MRKSIPTDDMIAFMVALPPDENITQAVIRGAMEKFGVKIGAANRAYAAATASGKIQQGVELRQARAYQGATQGCFCVPTGYYYWELRSSHD